MTAATLTSKGQLTLPIDVRRALQLHAGSKVDFVPCDDGFKMVPFGALASPLKGRFAGRVKEPASIEAMDQAIAQAASKRYRKSS